MFKVPGLCPSRGRVTPPLIPGSLSSPVVTSQVLDRAAFKFLELPAENVPIKRLHPLRDHRCKSQNVLRDSFADPYLFAVSILVVAANPIHRKVEVVLVATLRYEVEKIVSTDQNIEPASVRRIGVENIAVFIFVKHA